MKIGFESLRSDPCAYTYSESGAIYILILYVDDVLLLGKDLLVLRRIKQKLTSRFLMTDIGDVSLVLGMGCTRRDGDGDHRSGDGDQIPAGAVRYGKLDSMCMPDVGKELSLDQPDKSLLSEEETQKFQTITESVKFLGQVTRHDMLYAVNQMARAVSKPPKAHMAAAEHLPCCLARTVDFAIKHKQGGFKDTNWGNNPGSG